jgi:quercetin dioxygenase-like cupin family protein
MNEIFTPNSFATVADGTQVCAFLNGSDRADANRADAARLPRALADDMSIAAGRIQPGTWSAIHFHPLITQVTYVTGGKLSVKMKGPEADGPYLLHVPAGSVVVTQPGTLLQLGNETDQMTEVLYISSPAYVLVVGEDDEAGYDDALLAGSNWDSIAGTTERERASAGAEARRRQALARLVAAGNRRNTPA